MVSASPCGAGRDFDVVVIGGGVLGTAVASRLSCTTASVCLLEAETDVCEGASKGNAGGVCSGAFNGHCGRDYVKLALEREPALGVGPEEGLRAAVGGGVGIEHDQLLDQAAAGCGHQMVLFLLRRFFLPCRMRARSIVQHRAGAFPALLLARSHRYISSSG